MTILFDGLLADAAMLPPVQAAVADALAGHANARASVSGRFVGPLVCGDRDLAALAAAAAEDVEVSLVVDGGAGAIGPALAHAARSPRLVLRSVEVALRDEDDLAHNAQRMTTMLDLELPDDVTAAVELPRIDTDDPTVTWLEAADEVAAAGHGLKLRTGGPWPESYPSPAELVAFLDITFDRECATTLSGGFARAVVSGDGSKSLPSSEAAADGSSYGVLDVLLAVRRLLDGASVGEITDELGTMPVDDAAAAVRGWDDASAASVRRWVRSLASERLGACLEDLATFGVISDRSP